MVDSSAVRLVHFRGLVLMAKNRKRAKAFGTTLAYVRWFDSSIYKGHNSPPP